MPEESGGKKVVTAKLDLDINIALKALARRYKKETGVKGRVSISDGARYFITKYDPQLAQQAASAALQEDEMAELPDDE